LRLCRFVRIEILKDDAPPRKVVPIPSAVIHQIGDLILTKGDEISPDAVRLEVERLPDGGIPLPGGYVVRPVRKDWVIHLDSGAAQLPLRQRRLVEAWAEIHQKELPADWEQLQAGRPPFKIEPLR